MQEDCCELKTPRLQSKEDWRGGRERKEEEEREKGGGRKTREEKRRGRKRRERDQRKERRKKELGPWRPVPIPPAPPLTDSASQRNREQKGRSQLTPQPLQSPFTLRCCKLRPGGICSANHPKSLLQKESRIQSAGRKT